MFAIDILHYVTILVTLLVGSCNSERRIVSGLDIAYPARYIAYLVEPEETKLKYDGIWICGAAIVTPSFLISSAACVKDVRYMYAITGLKELVLSDKINTHPCANKVKRRVITICVPKKYTLDYQKVEVWANIDIAVLQIEESLDFDKKTDGCSWAPDRIPINYYEKYEAPNTDGIILGWGHSQKYREKEDAKNLNSEMLKYAPILIMDKEKCKQEYKTTHTELLPLIDNHMICAMSAGGITDTGEILPDCITPKPSVRVEVKKDDVVQNDTRRYPIKIHNTGVLELKNPGICQNDHGGPLVTWIGKQQYLIGVASVFRLNQNNVCSGPYLFTSTFRHAEFIQCLLQGEYPDSAVCKAVTGNYQIITRRVIWPKSGEKLETIDEPEPKNETAPAPKHFAGTKSSYGPAPEIVPHERPQVSIGRAPEHIEPYPYRPLPYPGTRQQIPLSYYNKG